MLQLHNLNTVFELDNWRIVLGLSSELYWMDIQGQAYKTHSLANGSLRLDKLLVFDLIEVLHTMNCLGLDLDANKLYIRVDSYFEFAASFSLHFQLVFEMTANSSS